MSRIGKKIAVLFVLFCLTLAGAIFAACGDGQEDETPAKETYTVTVYLPDGTTGVQGVTVEIYTLEGGVKTNRTTGVTVGGGKVTFSNLDKKDYYVAIVSLPSDYAAYSFDTNAVSTKTAGKDVIIRLGAPSATTEYSVIVPAGEMMRLDFAPVYGGRYAVYSTGDFDTYAEYYSGNEITTITNKIAENDDRSETDLNFYLEFNIQEDEIYVSDGSGGYTGERSNNIWYFLIGIKNGGTGTVTVVIERLGEPLVKQTVYTEMHATATEVYPDGLGVFKFAALNDSTKLVYNATDGFYHVERLDGPVLVTVFSGTMPLAVFGGTSFPDAVAGEAQLLYVNATPADEMDENDVEHPYRIEYYNTFVNEYAALSNSDGVYGVNREIYDYLHAIYSRNEKSWAFMLGNVSSDYGWLCLCGYYELYEATGGSGTQSDPYTSSEIGLHYSKIAAEQTVYYRIVSDVKYDISVTSDDSNLVITPVSDFPASPTEEEIDRGYYYVDFTLSAHDGAETEALFNVVGTEASAGSRRNPGTLSLGENTAYFLTEHRANGYYFTVVPVLGGSYTISSETTAATISYLGDASSVEIENTDSGFTVDFTLEEGETYLFKLEYKTGGDYFCDIVFDAANKPESGSGTQGDPYVITERGVYVFEVSYDNSRIYYKYSANAGDKISSTMAATLLVNNTSYGEDSGTQGFSYVFRSSLNIPFSVSTTRSFTEGESVYLAFVIEASDFDIPSFGSGTQNDPYEIDAGDYKIAAGETAYFVLTAKQDGYYTVDPFGLSGTFESASSEIKAFPYSWNLKAGDTVTFSIVCPSYSSDDYYFLLVTRGEPVEPGSSEDTAITGAAGTNTYAYQAGETKYFTFSAGNYTFNYGSELSLYAYRFESGTATLKWIEIPDGSSFEWTLSAPLYVRVTAEAAGSASFTVTMGVMEADKEGGINNPLPVTVGGSGTITLGNAIPLLGYFTFTPSQSGYYKVVCTTGSRELGYSVNTSNQSDLSSQVAYSVGVVPASGYFSEGTTYWIIVSGGANGDEVTASVQPLALTESDPYFYFTKTHSILSPLSPTVFTAVSGTLYLKTDLSWNTSHTATEYDLVSILASGCTVEYRLGESGTWTEIASGATFKPDENGVIYFRLTVIGGAATVDFGAEITEAEGSANNPVSLAISSGSSAVYSQTLAAGQSFYYYASEPLTLTAIGEGVTVTIGSSSYTQGILPAGGLTITGSTLAVTMTTAGTATITIGYAEGASGNPYAMTWNGSSASVNGSVAVRPGGGEASSVYVKVEISEAGSYTLALSSSITLLTVYLNNEQIIATEASSWSGTLAAGEIVFRVDNYSTDSSASFGLTLSKS